MDILNSNTKRSREIETLSLELKKHPTDLFHSFLPTSPNTTLRRHIRHQSHEPEKEELNLGLSLGGRFGVDKSHKGLLVRSSSLADAIPLIRAEEEAAAALVRTASLPPETEEEFRKRKELQNLRRMEAKRKRSDKHRCIIRENGSTENLNLNPGQPGKPNPGTGYPKSGFCGDLQGLFIQQQKQDGSQRSGESQGGSKSSSNASEPERINTIQGNMPCVFTIGDGPRGRRVEGILYRYKKGEEVRIMCVCHGSFFTPAEFLNHAGAHNVAHPLKRIVVNSNASPFS